MATNLISQTQAEAMSENEAANLIFHPGLSTAEQVTSLSGRGVGMDVVKSTIEKLGGAIELETRLGSGTKIIIYLSLVYKVEIIERSEIEIISKKQFINLEGRNILLIYLDQYLQLKPLPEEMKRLYIFTTKIKKFEVGIVASSIEESIHTRLNLDTPPINESIILGVTKIHDKLTFLLDLFSLAEKVSPDVFKTKAFSEASVKKRLLVVDDTPFFRDLEKKYFESIGCEVSLAFNGQEALEVLTAKPRSFDLVVTDIVMPVMDG